MSGKNHGGSRSKRSLRGLLAVGVIAGVCILAGALVADAAAGVSESGGASRSVGAMPGRVTAELFRVLTLRDYNTRVVVVGTTMLGLAAGLVGTFAYLRKRALMGDALSHATLPGVAIAFLVVGGKSLPALLIGASVTGVLGVFAVIGIRQSTRVKEDAAIGVVLSVFFGAGMALLSLIQQTKTGNAAGLHDFIYGKAASMISRDARIIGAVAAVVSIGVVALFKEFRLVCFDQDFAAAQGWPVITIDLVMMGLVVLVTVVGLQAVGLILVVALLIIPAVAARFWTEQLWVMALLAGIFGAMSGWAGSSVSALMPRMPTGAIIVVVAGILFAVSMLLAPQRGLLPSLARHWSLRRSIAYQHLLRALAEIEEHDGHSASVSLERLLGKRWWTPRQVRRVAERAVRAGVLSADALPRYQLTSSGRVAARRVLRNHRLWELYLIKYADIAPSHVDRDADEVEHVLPDHVIRELETALASTGRIPPTPHEEVTHP